MKKRNLITAKECASITKDLKLCGGDLEKLAKKWGYTLRGTKRLVTHAKNSSAARRSKGMKSSHTRKKRANTIRVKKNGDGGTMLILQNIQSTFVEEKKFSAAHTILHVMEELSNS